MAQPISNTVTNNSGGYPGLLAAPKQKAAAPVNFGALSLAPQQGAAPAPAQATTGINYNLPQPNLVKSLSSSGSAAPAAPVTKPVQAVTPPENNTGTGNTSTGQTQTTTTPPPGTANGTTTGTTQGLFPSVLSSIQGIAQNQQGLGQQAQTIAGNYGQEIANAGTEYQKAAAGYATTGTTPVAEGNENVALNTAANLTNSLTNAGNFALSGVTNAEGANVNASNALGTVATAAQPSGNFPFVFNPATGQFTTSGGDLPTSITSGVQQAISNPTLYSALNSAIEGTYGSAAAGMFQQAYIKAGGNPAVAAGQATGAQAVAAASGQTQAQNIQTAGTAGTSAASTAYQNAVQNVSDATQKYTALTGVSSQLNNALANWGNTGLITNYNAAINSIGGVTSNPNYQQFVVALGNTQAAYQSALGSAGVTPTKADVDALNALNPSSSANAINAAINQLSKDAHALLIVPAYQQQQTYAQQLGIQ